MSYRTKVALLLIALVFDLALIAGLVENSRYWKRQFERCQERRSRPAAELPDVPGIKQPINREG